MSRLRSYYSGNPVVLAPMDDVTDPVFRRISRRLGADLCFTEFVNVDSLLRGDHKSRRKMQLGPEDQPTAIQVYGADPRTLVEGALIAEAAGAAFIDINCGCWVPKIAARGAGAGWLRDPRRMIEMAALVVRSVGLPVSVKTRIGWGPESEMPVVDLARRLEDVGVSALTIHCRTALMRHDGPADWSWARKAQQVVGIPVIVNGDIKTAADCRRAFEETGCAGVMIGRAAINYPWVFREARALLDRGEVLPPPTPAERLDLLIQMLELNAEARSARNGVFTTRRHYAQVLQPVPGGMELREKLNGTTVLPEVIELLHSARARLSAS